MNCRHCVAAKEPGGWAAGCLAVWLPHRPRRCAFSGITFPARSSRLAARCLLPQPELRHLGGKLLRLGRQALDGGGEILRLGGVVENPAGLRPSRETGFHLGIYRARPDVRAVVHVHPTYPTVYSNRRAPVPLVTVSAENKLRQGSVVRAAAGGSGNLEAIAAAPTANVFLMERHDLTAFGPSLCQAFDGAELAEVTAKIAFLVGMAQPGSV